MTKQSIMSLKNGLPRRLSSARNDGFTLAEVLITLVIIGVIAAITVPTVMNNIKEQRTVNAVKVAYSKLSQAIQKAQVSNGPIKTWDNTNSTELFNILKPNFIITKDCGTGSGCFPDVIYKNLNNSNFLNIDTYTGVYKFKLQNGTSIAMLWINKTQTNFWVDINGDKGPNQWGKDLFMFITQDGKITLPYVPNDCTNDGGKGWYCSSWIITNSNINYPASTQEENEGS